MICKSPKDGEVDQVGAGTGRCGLGAGASATAGAAGRRVGAGEGGVRGCHGGASRGEEPADCGVQGSLKRCKEGWRRTAVALRQVGANGEIVLLQLDDLDWRTGEIVVHGKGRIVERLPLLAEIDEALTTYLCEDRDGGAPRRVFLRRLAP